MIPASLSILRFTPAFVGALTLVAATLSLASAQEASPKGTPKAATTGPDFVCERLRSYSLPDFKARMMETCDLNRPFSFTEGDAIDKATTYCCHRRR